LALPTANFVVTFGSDGRIDSKGSVSDVTKRRSLVAQLSTDQQALDKTQQEIDAPNPAAKPTDGKLIVAEEIQLGHLSASSCSSFITPFTRTPSS
jgi:hypothetical protein